MRVRNCLAVAALLTIAVGTTGAQETKPIQLSLVTPIQIFPDDVGISGLRINLLYGRNAFVRGLDWGLVNHTTTGESVGLQWGAVNLADANFMGWQSALVNLSKGEFTGLQSGGVNIARTGEGVQWGVVNTADNWNGLMFSLVNYAKEFKGLQVGLINIITSKDKLPVLPIINWK